MKKLLSYALPLIAAAGMATGCQKCEKEVKEEVPTKVTLEDVYYSEFESGEAVCYYKERLWHGSHESSETKSDSISVFARFKDPDGIKRITYDMMGIEFRPVTFEEKEKEHIVGLGGGTSLSKKVGYLLKFEVTDWQGNVTQHTFTLEDALEKAKPYTIRPKTTKWCPEKLE